MWHRCYPLRLIHMSSQLILSMPDIWHCQTIYTDFVPLINSIIVPDPVPWFSKDSGVRLVVRSYDLRYKLISGGLDIIFRLFKCELGVSILSLSMNFSIGFRTAHTVSFVFLFFKRISFIIFASCNWLVIVGSDIV
jgi:hypothetical protein